MQTSVYATSLFSETSSVYVSFNYCGCKSCEWWVRTSHTSGCRGKSGCCCCCNWTAVDISSPALCHSCLFAVNQTLAGLLVYMLMRRPMWWRSCNLLQWLRIICKQGSRTSVSVTVGPRDCLHRSLDCLLWLYRIWLFQIRPEPDPDLGRTCFGSQNNTPDELMTSTMLSV